MDVRRIFILDYLQFNCSFITHPFQQCSVYDFDIISLKARMKHFDDGIMKSKKEIMEKKRNKKKT